ncbi:MAG: CRTAC1 family protein [Acidobacteriota bacterium]
MSPSSLAQAAEGVTEVRVPADMKLESLAPRAAEQRAAARSWQVEHGFGFEDRLAQSGITFRHQIVDDAGLHYLAVHYDHGNGISAADIDGDDRIDIYFTTQIGSNELWRNLGDGRFENITARAGVALADRISVTSSFADVDNDGDPDLFVTTVRGGNALFLNDGRGVFRDATAEAGLAYSGHSSGATFFDYDNDGWLDLFLSNVGVYTIEEKGRGGAYRGIDDAFKGNIYPERSEDSFLYRNLGNGRFENVSKAALLVDRSWTGDATPADFDGDGFQDLYVADMQGPDRFYQNVGGRFFADRTAKFFPRTPGGTMGIKVFDWNRDGHLDLLLTDMHSDMMYELNPEEEKQKMTPLPGSPAAEEDGPILGNALFQGTADGTFREVSDEVGAENYWPWGLSVADLNADGWQDVFITSSMNYPFRYGINSVLLNAGGQRFVDAEFVLGVEPRAELLQPWFEIECPDPPVAEDSATGGEPAAEDEQAEAEGSAVHRDCAGVAGPVRVIAARGSRSSVVFDLEGDGDLDIVTNEFNTEPQVLVSDLAQRRPAAKLRFAVKLQGTVSNRDGLGARVRLVTDKGDQLRVHDGKSGYLSQSLLPLYFGVGANEKPLRLEVTWPSGARQTIEPLEQGRLRVVEPAAGESEPSGEKGR